jgi:hypothetical protein
MESGKPRSKAVSYEWRLKLCIVRDIADEEEVQTTAQVARGRATNATSVGGF